MQIRVAEECDANALARVVVTTYREAHRGYLPRDYLLSSLSYKQSAENWACALRRHARVPWHRERVFAAENTNSQIVGVAMGGPDRTDAATADAGAGAGGELSILYILPAYQHRGVGRLLVAAVARWLIEQGLSRMRVRVLRENLPARRFYAAIGGKEIGEEETEDEGVVLHYAVYEWANLQQHWPS